MKLLAVTDIHANPKFINSLAKKIRAQQPDVIVCCGDLSIFEHGLEAVIRWLATLPLPVLIIHGNHETPATLKKLLTKHNKHRNISFIHKQQHTINGITFIGWGGGGFAQVEPDFEHFTSNLKRTTITKPRPRNALQKKTVLITHAPPYGTIVDKIGKKWGHAGCKSITRFIKKQQPTLHLCGHLHECFGKKDMIGKTTILNPGPHGMIITL